MKSFTLFSKKCAILFLYFIGSLLLNGCATGQLWTNQQCVGAKESIQTEAYQIYASYDKIQINGLWDFEKNFRIQFKDKDNSGLSLEKTFPEIT